MKEVTSDVQTVEVIETGEDTGHGFKKLSRGQTLLNVTKCFGIFFLFTSYQHSVFTRVQQNKQTPVYVLCLFCLEHKYVVLISP